ncbi:HIT family protein [Hippea alviniae]|uniref:HIT family protein n=1 Tax=Hippea alviniae TaxID=1279027 RepID=UPI0003B46B47|nr:HIT family protein [Hippea alviniae]
MNSCIFCKYEELNVILKNELCYAIFDKYPVNKGHMLIIPYRHIESLFDATEKEIKAIFSLLKEAKAYLDGEFKPDGYNVGVNIGKYAGQTVMHLHVHLIPRYKGDIDNPTGGVRGVIPSKMRYPFS